MPLTVEPCRVHFHKISILQITKVDFYAFCFYETDGCIDYLLQIIVIIADAETSVRLC